MKHLHVTLCSDKIGRSAIEDKIFKKFVPKKANELTVVHSKVAFGNMYVGGRANIAIIPKQDENGKVPAKVLTALNALKVTGWDYLPENLYMDSMLCVKVWFSTAHQYPAHVIAALEALKLKVNEVTCDKDEVELLLTKKSDIHKPLSLTEQWMKLIRLNQANFTDWEKNFTTSILRQLNAGKSLSEKQMEFVRKILGKYKVNSAR